jgi:hypothetical protein
MQHIPTIDAAKRAFRAVICPHCPERPHGSEILGPTVPRSCEPNCSLFLQVDQLRRIATAPNHFEMQIREEICNRTCRRPTAGDFCAERLNGTCPLALFGREAISILSGLVAAEHIAQERLIHAMEQKKTA